MKSKPAFSFGFLERLPKSRAELEALLIADLRRHDGCEHVEQVVVVSQLGAAEQANWTVSCFRYGGSSGQACDRALQEIVPRLQRAYELVQKH